MQFQLNNTVPEPDRSMDMLGFDNVPTRPVANVPQGMGVLTPPHPLIDEAVEHSNTTPATFPPNGTQVFAATDQLR